MTTFDVHVRPSGTPLAAAASWARRMADEVRHVQLCADAVAVLGGTPVAAIPTDQAYLLVDPATWGAPIAAASMNTGTSFGASMLALYPGCSRSG